MTQGAREPVNNLNELSKCYQIWQKAHKPNEGNPNETLTITAEELAGRVKNKQRDLMAFTTKWKIAARRRKMGIFKPTKPTGSSMPNDCRFQR